MAALVNAQGEMINQIEVYVGEAVKDTEQGVVELKKANKIQKSSRKVQFLPIFTFRKCVAFLWVSSLSLSLSF
jgi:t-SNARE complex subunit (syntaxin)